MLHKLFFCYYTHNSVLDHNILIQEKKESDKSLEQAQLENKQPIVANQTVFHISKTIGMLYKCDHFFESNLLSKYLVPLVNKTT